MTEQQLQEIKSNVENKNRKPSETKLALERKHMVSGCYTQINRILNEEPFEPAKPY